jgi:hypothetical protein
MNFRAGVGMSGRWCDGECGEMLNNLAVYVVETSFKIRLNLCLLNQAPYLDWFGAAAHDSLYFSTTWSVLWVMRLCCFTSGEKSSSSPFNERLDGPQSRFGWDVNWKICAAGWNRTSVYQSSIVVTKLLELICLLHSETLVSNESIYRLL